MICYVLLKSFLPDERKNLIKRRRKIHLCWKRWGKISEKVNLALSFDNKTCRRFQAWICELLDALLKQFIVSLRLAVTYRICSCRKIFDMFKYIVKYKAHIQN